MIEATSVGWSEVSRRLTSAPPSAAGSLAIHFVSSPSIATAFTPCGRFAARSSPPAIASFASQLATILAIVSFVLVA